MWKLKTIFNGRTNMKKQDVMFSLMPTLVYMTNLYNTKTSYTIAIVWLFFNLNFELTFENK